MDCSQVGVCTVLTDRSCLREPSLSDSVGVSLVLVTSVAFRLVNMEAATTPLSQLPVLEQGLNSSPESLCSLSLHVARMLIPKKRVSPLVQCTLESFLCLACCRLRDGHRG